jgi:hypothetical protein
MIQTSQGLSSDLEAGLFYLGTLTLTGEEGVWICRCLSIMQRIPTGVKAIGVNYM